MSVNVLKRTAGIPSMWSTATIPRRLRRQSVEPAKKSTGPRLFLSTPTSVTGVPKSRTPSRRTAIRWGSMDKFYLPDDSVKFFRQVGEKGAKEEKNWQTRFDAYKKAFPKEAGEL